MTIPELISRLEAATEPSRELDALIWCAVYDSEFVGLKSEHSFLHRPSRLAKPYRWGHTFTRQEHYTSSVDSALTLVPDDWMPELESFRTEHGKQYKWTLWRLPDRITVKAGPSRNSAMALARACLKARVG